MFGPAQCPSNLQLTPHWGASIEYLLPSIRLMFTTGARRSDGTSRWLTQPSRPSSSNAPASGESPLADPQHLHRLQPAQPGSLRAPQDLIKRARPCRTIPFFRLTDFGRAALSQTFPSHTLRTKRVPIRYAVVRLANGLSSVNTGYASDFFQPLVICYPSGYSAVVAPTDLGPAPQDAMLKNAKTERDDTRPA